MVNLIHDETIYLVVQHVYDLFSEMILNFPNFTIVCKHECSCRFNMKLML